MQGLLAVRVLNCSLRFCASWPFWTAKPFALDTAAGALDGAGDWLEDVGVGSTAEGDVF